MVDVSGQVVIAVLTRAPSAGGKSRLFQALDRAPDPALLRALLLDTLDAAELPGAARVVCVTPPGSEGELRAMLPADVDLRAQREHPDLGVRMRAAFDDLLDDGARAVLLIGSDLPLLPDGALARAQTSLQSKPQTVVIGPATDGGYYLIGATQTPAALLEGLDWGRPDVLSRTCAKAQAAGIDLLLLPSGSDVDTPEALREVARGLAPRGRRTRSWVSQNL